MTSELHTKYAKYVYILFINCGTFIHLPYKAAIPCTVIIRVILRPYPSQLDFMACVYDTLESGGVGILVPWQSLTKFPTI